VRTHSGLLGAIFRTPSFKAEEAAIAQRAQELLDYVGIGKYADYKARTLSYGDQRRLEIARALALNPKVLLLDEPSLGLAPTVITDVFERLQEIKESNGNIKAVHQEVNQAIKQLISKLNKEDTLLVIGSFFLISDVKV
jgi:branched-chain amino acid transport system ATP-binding protein